MEPASAAAPWGYLMLLAVLPAAWLTARVMIRSWPTPETAMSRFGSLDGIRGLLALAVMAHHFRIAWNWQVTGRWEMPAEVLFMDLGPGGVLMFFMITGFLFWGKLVIAGGRLDLVPFALSRLFRIYPAYLLSLLAIAMVSAAVAPTLAPLPFAEAVRSLYNWLIFAGDGNIGFRGFGDANVINAGVIWTLRYEGVFYASLPFIGLGLRLLRPGTALRTVTLVALILYARLVPLPSNGWFQGHFVVAFAYGALAYELQRSEILRRWLQGSAASIAAAAAAAAMLLSADPYGPSSYLLLGMAFAILAAGNSLFGLLHTREAIALGDASYGIYLFHGIAVFLFFEAVGRKHLGSPLLWLGLPLVAAVVCAFSLVCFARVEQPAIRLGKSLAGLRRRVTASEEVAP